MADDLDDFFAEVDDVAAQATEEDGDADTKEQQKTEGDDTVDPPPSKRIKTSDDTTSTRSNLPKGIIVAAASSVKTTKTDSTAAPRPSSNGYGTMIASSASVDIGPSMTNASNATGPLHGYNGNVANQPSTHSGPPPPPPPPPLPPSGVVGPSPPSAEQQQETSTAKPIKRMAAGKVWVDPTLQDWPENDFRIFIGNLSRDITDEMLQQHFQQYASLARAKVVADRKGVSKGYGFCSFLQPLDCAKAIREKDQSWLSSRPIRVKRSDWRDRNMNAVQKKSKQQRKQQSKR